MSRNLRRRLYVDRHVQSALLARFLVYWACIVVFITLLIAISQTFVEPEKNLVQHYVDTWCSHWPVLAGLGVLLPFVIYDTLKVSHRFAGPIFRLRREMRRFVEGEDAEPVRFRDGDFWPELGEYFTQMMERCRSAERRVAELEQAAGPSRPGLAATVVPADEVPAAV